MERPAAEFAQRLERLLGKRAASWRRATGGYTTAERWLATFENGTSCFVKSGAAHLAEALRAEYGFAYSRFKAPFLPRLLAWDDGEAPMLVLEDLSEAWWPPPWRAGDVEAVLDAVAQVGALQLDGLPPVEAKEPTLRDGWRTVAAEPGPFLGLGLATPAWLESALPALIGACDAADLDGDATVHFDVRSDNVCFVDGRAVLIDWNHVCRGNPQLDVAAWAPSLHSEGGPLPESVLPDAAELAAVMSGYFAARAGLPPIWQAPTVRTVQLSQLRSALPWAVRALGLPPPDGPQAPV